MEKPRGLMFVGSSSGCLTGEREVKKFHSAHNKVVNTLIQTTAPHS